MVQYELSRILQIGLKANQEKIELQVRLTFAPNDIPVESSRLQKAQTLATNWLHWYCSPTIRQGTPSHPATPSNTIGGAPAYTSRHYIV